MIPVELVVSVFAGEEQAGNVLRTLKTAQREGTLFYVNAAVLVKDTAGRTSSSETEDVDAGKGAIFGTIVGGFLGLLGGPVGALAGAAAGALTGGVSAHLIDTGFSDKDLKDLEQALTPGSSALVVLVEYQWTDRLITMLRNDDGRIFRQVLPSEIAAKLAAENRDAHNTPEP